MRDHDLVGAIKPGEPSPPELAALIPAEEKRV